MRHRTIGSRRLLRTACVRSVDFRSHAPLRCDTRHRKGAPGRVARHLAACEQPLRRDPTSIWGPSQRLADAECAHYRDRDVDPEVDVRRHTVDAFHIFDLLWPSKQEAETRGPSRSRRSRARVKAADTDWEVARLPMSGTVCKQVIHGVEQCNRCLISRGLSPLSNCWTKIVFR
jgi:hypothetical protein